MPQQATGTWHVSSITPGQQFSCELPMGQLMATHPARPWRPPTDVFECDRVYVIRTAISGLRKNDKGELEDAEVTVENDTVIIRGHRRDHSSHAKRVFYQMEVHYGHFEVRVRINRPFGRDGVAAQYKDGFLEVIVPKEKQAGPDTRRIRVGR